MPSRPPAAMRSRGPAADEIVVQLPAQPLSPWLRLAHVTTIGRDASGRGGVRTIDDYMLMLQVEGMSFIWWEALAGSVALPSGAIAFIPPGRAHAWGVCAGAHVAVHFDLHANPGLLPLAMLHHRDQWVDPAPLARTPIVHLLPQGSTSGVRIPLVTPLRRPGAMRTLLDPLVQMYGSRTHDSLEARLVSAAILARAVAGLGQASTRSGASPDPRILALLAELDDQHARRWTVSSLCRRAGMGRTAFLEAFSAMAGCTPRRHLESIRIERAAHLLVGTDLPIHEVASQVGFQDPYHFTRVFHRQMGCAPRTYRLASSGARS
jgi:AraC-like DNA-binding protein